MKKWYEGKRTHIANIVTGLASILLVAGLQIDPAVVMGFLDQAWQWVLAGYAGLHALIAWFRELGKKDKQEIDEHAEPFSNKK